MAEFILEHLGAILTIASSILGILYIRSQIALSRQNKAIEDMKSDNKHRDNQLELVKKMAEDTVKRDLAYADTLARREEAWQRTIKEFSLDIKDALRELVDEFKEDRRVVSAEIERNAIANRNLSAVLENQINRIDTLEAEVRTSQQLSIRALEVGQNAFKSINDNVDHAVYTMEAIRNRIINLINELSMTPIIHKLNEIQESLNKEIETHETPHNSADPSLLPAIADVLVPGTGPG